MMEEFRVLDSSDPVDRGVWIDAWNQWDEREVQAHPAYGEIFALEGDRVMAALGTGPRDHTILYPYLLRKIESGLGSGNLYDMSSPYGYGGPFTWGTDTAPESSRRFWNQLNEWMRTENVISEFIRFALFGTDADSYPGETVMRQVNVIVGLERSPEDLWRSFASKVRRNVNRAQKEGVHVVLDSTPAGVDKFHPIYLNTMLRRSANLEYHFSRNFFERLHNSLPGKFAYFHAIRQGEVVSTELVLVSEATVYFFLGGTLLEGFPVRANELLKYEVMKWAMAQGKKRYVLGGGHEPNDGIERYKRAFAPDGLFTFSTGQRVVNQSAYDNLVALHCRSENMDTHFFPKYRE
jgi:hypothetical protein